MTQSNPIDKRIGQYVALRDEIKRLDDAHKEKMKPYREALEGLNNYILQQLLLVGGQSLNTDMGTAYITEKKSATINDPVAFRRHVIGTEAWDMIDWKANAVQVEVFIKDHKVPPPGVDFKYTNVVGVRRPSGKGG